VQERIERANGPDEAVVRPPEHVRDDLRQRLEQLADRHPSSEGYRDADPTRRDASADSARTAAGPTRESGQASSHLDRPAESDTHVPADRERHILDGDADSDGGGHRHGTGRPGKTEFPKAWSDAEIVSVVEDVGRKPDHAEWQPNGRWRVTGDHDGVRVHAIVVPDGRIWTAWPEPGGKGVVQNPEAS
jgi:Bacterial EndoU nuclease